MTGKKITKAGMNPKFWLDKFDICSCRQVAEPPPPPPGGCFGGPPMGGPPMGGPPMGGPPMGGPPMGGPPMGGPPSMGGQMDGPPQGASQHMFFPSKKAKKNLLHSKLHCCKSSQAILTLELP